jgi:uncharacterized membrane protein
VLDNIFVETILYVYGYLQIGQDLCCEYMLYIVNLYIVLLSIIRIGHAKIYCLFDHLSLVSSFFVLSHQLSINQQNQLVNHKNRPINQLKIIEF